MKALAKRRRQGVKITTQKIGDFMLWIEFLDSAKNGIMPSQKVLQITYIMDAMMDTKQYTLL